MSVQRGLRSLVEGNEATVASMMGAEPTAAAVELQAKLVDCMAVNALSAEMLLARFFDERLLARYCTARLGKSSKGSAATLAARAAREWARPAFEALPPPAAAPADAGHPRTAAGAAAAARNAAHEAPPGAAGVGVAGEPEGPAPGRPAAPPGPARGTVLQFFSKSAEADDLGLGVPGWRRVLSNFHPAAVALDGRRYPTAEHAFHAAKARCSDRPQLAADFEVGGRVGGDPVAAKRAGGRAGFARRGATLDRSRWGRECDEVQLRVLRQRAAADALFGRILRAVHTRGLRLLHFERAGARSYWGGSISRGTGELVGENRLGKLMLQVAAEAAAAAAAGEGQAAEEPAGAIIRGIVNFKVADGAPMYKVRHVGDAPPPCWVHAAGCSQELVEAFERRKAKKQKTEAR
jgi:predicted NAD-dependent protein-ADP-ribosyltransferase YbiA (DUF1768 family)